MGRFPRAALRPNVAGLRFALGEDVRSLRDVKGVFTDVLLIGYGGQGV